MSIYIPLEQFLRTSDQDLIRLTFSELEFILGFTLPKSAYTYNAWWTNGGHSQSKAWLSAGYKVERADLQSQTVFFCKGFGVSKHVPKLQAKKLNVMPIVNFEPMPIDQTTKTMMVYGYKFRFLQYLMPECDARGKIIKYYPQAEYNNKEYLPLLHHGHGAFCRFSIQANNCPGVYLWVVNSQIIYIGETEGLQRRFNMGYGRISPRNCYVGGQSTNCKMNKAVLTLYEQGKIVSLFFYNTEDYKRVELDLLEKINTPYNMKNN